MINPGLKHRSQVSFIDLQIAFIQNLYNFETSAHHFTVTHLTVSLSINLFFFLKQIFGRKFYIIPLNEKPVSFVANQRKP